MATINAASASSTDINTAITAAADGDIVSVPSGSVAWTSNVTIPSTKGISLIGAGVGVTNITMGAYNLTLSTSPTNSRVRVSGFRFINAPTGGITINNRDTGATNWRLDHLEMLNGGTGYRVFVNGYTFGVMDNVTWDNAGVCLFVDNQTRPFDVTGSPIPYPGGYSWQQPLDAGGPSHVYVEDCIFRNGTWIMFDCRAGSRVVFRHNTITGPVGMETHSGCTPGYRNPRWMEMYENTFDTLGGVYWCPLFIRATNGMFFNNSFSTGYANTLRFDNEILCRSDCIGCWPLANLTVYPTQDQIGSGRDTGFGTAQDQDEAKLLFWGNTFGGVHTDAYFSSCAQSATMTQHNRDYWQQVTPFTGASGIGVGLLSARPGSSIEGVCYWATDTDVLYRVNSGGQWVELYRPYTYPHPLREEYADSISVSGRASSSSSSVGQASLTRASAASDYFENVLLNHAFKVAEYTPPAHIYVALCKSTVDESDTGSTLPSEVTGGGYARTACDAWGEVETGHIDNENSVVFAQATADWGMITDIALCDATTDGNVLTYGKLFNYKEVNIGDIMQFEAGSIDVTLD